MKKLRKIDLYIIPLFFVCIAAVVLRSVALLTSFDTVIMHYTDKVAITIANVLTAISALGFGSYIFLGEKEKELIARSDNARSYIPAGLVSIALLFMGASLLGSLSEHQAGVVSALSVVCAILAFLSAGSFLITVLIERGENFYKAAFSLSIVFFLALYAMMLFFNREIHPTNSPNKTLDQLAYLSAAIFFLFESRICLGRAKWRGYVAFGLIASLLCCYSALPSLIVYAVNGYTVSDSLAESMLTLTVFILVTSKVIQSRNLTPAEECPTARSITALAERREDEIKEQHSLTRTHASNNMVENDTEDASNYTFDIPEAEPITDFSPDGAISEQEEKD